MVFDGPACALFAPTDVGTLFARERAICDFGPSALLTHTQEKIDPMADATETFKFRLPLRQIAKALGKVEKELDAIRMTVPQLLELIKTEVPGIAEMPYEEVQALAATFTAGARPTLAQPAAAVQKSAPVEVEAPTEAAPVKRGPGRPAKPKTPGSAPAPAVEVVEPEVVRAEEESAPTRFTPGKPGPKVPMRRAAAAAAPQQAEPSEVQQAAPAVAQMDIGPLLHALEDLRKRIDVIGQQSDAINTAVKDLNTRVKRVEDAFGTQDDRISAMVGALSFLYATASGDEDGDSIENIDWASFLGNG